MREYDRRKLGEPRPLEKYTTKTNNFRGSMMVYGAIRHGGGMIITMCNISTI